MADFMQFTDEPDLTTAEDQVLSDCGQFFSCEADFKFLARLRAAKATQKEIESWFTNNERRQIWNMAQGVLASVYGQDPP